MVYFPNRPKSGLLNEQTVSLYFRRQPDEQKVSLVCHLTNYEPEKKSFDGQTIGSIKAYNLGL